MIAAGLLQQQERRAASLKTLAKLRQQAAAEIDRLIQFLDQSDEYVMTELEDGDEREDVGDSEPSLGSFDRMTDQTKSWRQGGLWEIPGTDAELDDCDREDDDPDEAKDQQLDMGGAA